MTVVVDAISAVEPSTVFVDWLEAFGRELEARDAEALAGLFADDGYWKDFLAFTWEHRIFSGPGEIRDAFADSLGIVQPRRLRLADGRAAPRLLRRSGKWVIEGFADFDTRFGRGTAFVRLYIGSDPAELPKVWLMLTTLQALHGFEDKIGRHRPSGNDYAMNTRPTNWADDRAAERSFRDRNPEVLIVGAGHAGLILAARLKQMEVDTLVIDKTPRIGDVWRDRYHSLTLHNETTANHMPYMPFPETWPTWMPKDRLAGWLEAYAEAMDLNVWCGTELVTSEYNAEKRAWTARLRQADGSERVVETKHLVVAIGVSGSIPNRPEIPGLADFDGEVRHSGEYSRGADYRGKHAIVIGTGNSGHDVAQDLAVNGAEKVWIYQRSPTCVVSLEPSAISVFKIYSEGPSVDDIDLVTSALPYPVLEDTYRFMTKRAAQADRELIAALNRVGFETYYGSDDTGFHMMYLRGEGGYYINVGCSELIIEGKVGVLQHRDADRFVAEGLRMKDGSVIPSDLVVLATGFRNMQEGIRRMVGDQVADKVGPIWGFDRDYQMRNMWRRTAQDGFWVMGGALIDARLNSRFLALEIKASLLGILPERSAMPIVRRPDETT